MKLYLIRHGQSRANLAKCYSGWAQYELTEQGEAEAKRAGELLSGIVFDKVYSSDLIRAIKTQQIALPDIEAERTSLLREINVGDFSGKPIAECVEKYGDIFMKDRKAYDFSPFGGESPDMFKKRINEFLSLAANSGYERVAAFCHGGFIRTALDIVTGALHDKDVFISDNCGIFVFEYTNGKWRVKTWNYTGTI